MLASGPSAKTVDIGLARGKARVIVTNKSWELCPWADVLYGCDWKWWDIERGVPGFAGLKICGDQRAEREGWGCMSVKVLVGIDTMHMEPGFVGRGGGSSGFQSVNLALQWGVKKIILAGFDCSIARGVHWHGNHGTPLGNPNPDNTRNWQRCMDNASASFRAMGVSVLNVSPQSALAAYPKMSLAEALAP